MADHMVVMDLTLDDDSDEPDPQDARATLQTSAAAQQPAPVPLQQRLPSSTHDGAQTAGAVQAKIERIDAQLAQVDHDISVLLAKQSKLREQRNKYAQILQAEQMAPRKDWSQDKFAWDEEAARLLRNVFKLNDFRPMQREGVNATMQGRDVLCLLPSGGGKSLCYQLPALLARTPAQQDGSADGTSAKQGGSSAPILSVKQGSSNMGGASVQQQHGHGQQQGMGAAGRQLTLVVSPLLSLIQDQVAGLEALGIPAAALTSLSSKEETAAVFNRLVPAQTTPAKKNHKGKKAAASSIRAADAPVTHSASAGTNPDAGVGREQDNTLPALLYVTPERVVSSKRLMGKLEKLCEAGQLSRIAVDEAHCTSAWGNDFRTDYKKLGILRTMFPKVPILALTATATHQVQKDICGILNMPAAEIFASSINRPNLHYQVALKPAAPLEASAVLVSWISSHYPEGESGIVYALTRKDCEVLCGQLVEAGIRAVHYHADMDPAARQSAHAAWSRGDAQVVVATIAFGMGINKPDVRFVIHASLSKSVENYYQESGRAGRDGLPARCLLFYRFSDALRQAAIVCYEPNWWQHLRGMMSYAASTQGCRRAALQAHFSEAPADCKCMCDSCMRHAAPPGVTAASEVDVSTPAATVIRVLSSVPHAKATLIQLTDAWRKTDKAVAKNLGKEAQEQVVEAMLLRGYLKLDFSATAYTTNVYLTPSDAGKRWQAQVESATGTAPKLMLHLRLEGDTSLCGASPNCEEDADGAAVQLLPCTAAETALREWREQQAEEQSVLPGSVLCDQGLARLCDLVAREGSRDLTVERVTQVLGPIKSASQAIPLVRLLRACSIPAPAHSVLRKRAATHVVDDEDGSEDGPSDGGGDDDGNGAGLRQAQHRKPQSRHPSKRLAG